MQPQVELPIIEALSVTMKEGKTKISFEAMMTPAEIARLLNFSRQGRPLNAIISSPQATMDLHIEEVELATGVIAGEG